MKKNSQENSQRKNIGSYGIYIFLQLFLLIFIVFLLISVHFNNNFIVNIDNFVFNCLKIFRNNVLIEVFYIITIFGETWFIVFSLLILLLSKERKKFLPLIIIMIISALLNSLIKNIICRPRPEGLFISSNIFSYSFPSSFSFPSGHSQNSLVFYFVLTNIVLENHYKGKHKKLLLSLSTILPILIMLSRVVIGVHYFSDVLMGALMGILIICIYYAFSKNFFNKRSFLKGK